MLSFRQILMPALLVFCVGATSLHAQTVPSSITASSGALLIVPAFGELTQANDQVRATFMVEEQNKDKAIAASLVNKKMKQGTDAIRRSDSSALLKTRGYYTYPVYAEEPAQVHGNTQHRQLIGWRAGQYLDMTTTNLDGLRKTVSAIQNVVALNGLQFGLSDATRKQLDSQLISAAYQNLTERVMAIAHAMGRNVSDALIETIDFEGSGAYAPNTAAPKMMMRAASTQADIVVEEPSFEPGETVLNMRLVGKIKFK